MYLTYIFIVHSALFHCPKNTPAHDFTAERSSMHNSMPLIFAQYLCVARILNVSANPQEVAEADVADVDIAVAAARRAFDEGPWPKMSGAVCALNSNPVTMLCVKISRAILIGHAITAVFCFSLRFNPCCVSACVYTHNLHCMRAPRVRYGLQTHAVSYQTFQRSPVGRLYSPCFVTEAVYTLCFAVPWTHPEQVR